MNRSRRKKFMRELLFFYTPRPRINTVDITTAYQSFDQLGPDATYKKLGGLVQFIWIGRQTKMKSFLWRVFFHFQPISNTDSESDTVVLRRLPRSNVENHRLSVISNDSSISRDSRFSGNSSVGSVGSYTDSCTADSNSDIYGNRFSSGLFAIDRPRMARAIYSPSSDPQIKTSRAEDSSEGRIGNTRDCSQNTSDAKESDAEDYGTLKPNSHLPINRKFVSTSQLQSGTFLTPMAADGTLTRTQSTITAIRIDDDGLSNSLLRPSTCETLVPSGER